MRIAHILLISLSVAMLGTAAANAQVNWMSPLHEPGVSLEISKVSFDADQHLSFFTMQYTLASRIALNERTFFLLEAPFAHAGYKNKYAYYAPDQYSYSQTSFGNPYIGMESSFPGSSLIFQLGLRLPLATYDNWGALGFGYLAARDRWEAYFPKLTTIEMGFGFRDVRAGQNRFQFLLNPTVMVPEHGDAELLADCNAEFWLTSQKVRTGFGLTGRFIATESGSFSERTEFLAGVSLSATVGRFHPGVHLRVPFDESVQDVINYTYGLNLTVDFPGATSNREF